jgi:YD repeat-containing protein
VGAEFTVHMVVSPDSRALNNLQGGLVKSLGDMPVAYSPAELLGLRNNGNKQAILVQRPQALDTYGDSIRTTLGNLKGVADNVTITSSNFEGADKINSALDRYFRFSTPENRVPITSVRYYDPFQSAGLLGKTPLTTPDNKALIKDIASTRGLVPDTFVVTTEGKIDLAQIGGVKGLRENGIHVFAAQEVPKISFNPLNPKDFGYSNAGNLASDLGSPKLWKEYTPNGLTQLHQSPVENLAFSRAIAQPVKPAGILLAPDLEIVADAKGLTGKLAGQAVAAVKGDKAGGEFTFEGKQYIAAKAPGTAGLFRVRVGNFTLEQKDLSLVAAGEETCGLSRYYDSASGEKTAFGLGWSLLPYSLRIGQTEDVPNFQHKVAKQPVLVDRETGAELEYGMIPPLKSTGTNEPAEPLLPFYGKLTSSQQPDLIIGSNGTYTVRFIHGFELVFNDNGSLLSSGTSTDRTLYRYAEGRLAAVENSAGKITIAYNAQGAPTEAKTSDGRRVDYIMDEKGRLAAVTGSESGRWEFSYGGGNRLASIKRGAGQDADAKLSLIAENKYDAKGRMVMHHTPQGEWRFAYDDEVGRVVITGPDGKVTSYYYDGYQRLVAYGSAKDDMTLLNYDVSGRVLQVAKGELLNNPSGGERPRFKVLNMVTPLPHEKETKQKEG